MSIVFFLQIKSDFSVCCYSHCGKYIAAGATNGEITVWDVAANRIIREEKTGINEAQCITSIDWSSNLVNNGELAYTDSSGQFGLIYDIIDGDNDFLNGDDELVENGDDVNFGDSKY